MKINGSENIPDGLIYEAVSNVIANPELQAAAEAMLNEITMLIEKEK